MENKGFEEEKASREEPGKLTNGLEKEKSNVSANISVAEKGGVPDKPYSGMGKEDLLRFSDTPFWNNLRLACFIIFWVCWAALLATVLGMTITAPRCESPPAVSWWQSAPFYQVYVRSFYDSDGDGIGDIQGIIQKMEHFEKLNVAGIIISSFYRSHLTDAPTNDPSPDYGYDITNHTDIDAVYGNMEDVEELIKAAHERDIKLILEFIPNHTGTNHSWFVSSNTDFPGTYDQYYVWADCVGAPVTFPNNWKSIYNDAIDDGVPAWSEGLRINEPRCYLHQGLSSQPDLNLRSPQVREELRNILRFWLNKGVDGFRVNSAKYLYEDYERRDDVFVSSGLCANDQNDTPYDCYNHIHTTSLDENFGIIAEWRGVIDEYNEADSPMQRVLITDVKENVNTTFKYYGTNGQDGANFALNYDIIANVQNGGCNGECIDNLVQGWVENNEAHVTPDWMTAHQDEPRLPDDVYTDALLVLKMTLPGSSILYYGEEIGMTNGNVSAPCLDPGASLSICRDRSRTPMQWDNSDNGGFSNSTSWLSVNADYTSRNVKAFEDDSNEFNTLQVYMKMAEIQNTSTAFQYGIHETVVVSSDIYSFVRHFDGTDRYLITMNVGDTPSTDDYSKHSMVPGNAAVVVSNKGWSADQEVNLKNLEMEPGEYAVFTWPYDR